MNYAIVFRLLGYVLMIEGALLLLPAAASLVYGEWMVLGVFLLTAAVSAGIGYALHTIKPRSKVFYMREGFAATSLCWVFISVMGAVPFVLTGCIPNPVDALFETVSGFTTTGASILTAVEPLSRGGLLWRSFTHWVGGMGVLVLFLALMPKLGDGAVYLMRAESPGPIKSKLVPKVGSTAKILYTIYLALTALEMLCLRLAGLTWFSAVNHAFTTMATGGFSINNTSLSGSSPAVMWIVTIFSFLAGVNFSLLFLAVTGKLRTALHSEELRVYTAVVVGMTLLICLCLRLQAGIPLSGSITDAAFQTVTIITTTGFATVDFAMWPTFCRMALLVLMFSGGCAGSTAGGMKVSRVLILWKSLVRELKRMVHPNHVSVIKVDGQPVEERVVSSTGAYIMAYMVVLLAGALVVSWDNYGFQESFAASLTCISNVGPGLGILGPMENFSILSPLSKVVLSLEMLTGRLELMPMLALLSRGKTTSSAILIAAAFVGAMVSMGFVLLISQRVKRMSLLVVCGVMIGYICSALTDFLVTFADDSSIVNLHNWSLGSFSGMSWENVKTMAAVCGVTLLLTFLLSKPIRAYQLGEVYAQNMGVPLRAFRTALILLSSVLSACVTAFAGPISFVGIAVPHLMKSLFKSAEPLVMIPACFLGGGVFCLFCDLIARTAFAPTEVSISSVTAVFGAPIVIYMMIHRKAA